MDVKSSGEILNSSGNDMYQNGKNPAVVDQIGEDVMLQNDISPRSCLFYPEAILQIDITN
jgi:hypothetical protein